MAYIDTSVLVAYYCPEPLSTQAEDAIRTAERPAISPLTEVEFSSALAIKIRTGQMVEPAAERVLSKLRTHLDEQVYDILPVETEHYLLAAGWIGRFTTALRTLDALHVAVAFTADIPVITADEALAASAEHFGIPHTLLA